MQISMALLQSTIYASRASTTPRKVQAQIVDVCSVYPSTCSGLIADKELSAQSCFPVVQLLVRVEELELIRVSVSEDRDGQPLDVMLPHLVQETSADMPPKSSKQLLEHGIGIWSTLRLIDPWVMECGLSLRRVNGGGFAPAPGAPALHICKIRSNMSLM